jgi:hypothetical protein
MLAEFSELGFNALIIDSEQLSHYKEHEISLGGTKNWPHRSDGM